MISAFSVAVDTDENFNSMFGELLGDITARSRFKYDTIISVGTSGRSLYLSPYLIPQKFSVGLNFFDWEIFDADCLCVTIYIHAT